MTARVKGVRGGAAFRKDSLVYTDCDHILIDTVKRSEDGSAVVVRLYEFANRKDDAVLHFGRPVKRVTETNLCEEGETEIEVVRDQISFAIGCFEIKTFKVYL